MDGLDAAGGTQLAAQGLDVLVERARLDGGGVIPDLLEDLLARGHLPDALDQEGQEIELEPGERKLRAFEESLSRDEPQRQGTALDFGQGVFRQRSRPDAPAQKRA